MRVCNLKMYFLISHPKYMLSVLKKNVKNDKYLRKHLQLTLTFFVYFDEPDLLHKLTNL